MNVKDMKEFIKDLPDDTRLCMAVGETTCDGRPICIFEDIKHAVGYDTKSEDKIAIVFIHNKKMYAGFVERHELLINMRHPHWD